MSGQFAFWCEIRTCRNFWAKQTLFFLKAKTCYFWGGILKELAKKEAQTFVKKQAILKNQVAILSQNLAQILKFTKSTFKA